MSLRFGLFAILFALLGCRVSAQDIAPQSSSPPASSTSEHSQADTTADRQVETSNPTISAQHVGAGLSAPKVTQSPEPEYPEEARRAGYQGTVTLRLIVDAQGKPQKIKVQRSLGMRRRRPGRRSPPRAGSKPRWPQPTARPSPGPGIRG